MNYYGIDLGTTSTIFAKVTKDDFGSFSVSCIPNKKGEVSTASVINYTSNGIVIGEDAKKMLFCNPNATIELIKLKLGVLDSINIIVDNITEKKTPESICSDIIVNSLKSIDHEFKTPIVTVPAFFNQNKKDSIMEAIKLANIDTKMLIDEPSCAIIYHIFSQYEKNGNNIFLEMEQKNVLVFDFGGGTLDLSVIRLRNNNGIEPEILLVGGAENIGGNIIDTLITKSLLESLHRKYKPDDKLFTDAFNCFLEYYKNTINNNIPQFDSKVAEETLIFISEVKKKAEKLKIDLSTMLESSIEIDGYEPFPITRETFESFFLECNDYNIEELIDNALSELVDKCIEFNYNIDEVILVGGSSQIPKLKEIIINNLDERGISDEKIFFSNDFTYAVAKGSALLNAILSGESIQPFNFNKFDGVVSRDIEIEYLSKRTVIVKKGTKYPFEEPIIFDFEITHSLDTNIKLTFSELIQGKDQKRKPICNIKFYLPCFYTGEKLRLEFQIDKSGLYKINITHCKTNETVEFEPRKLI